MTETILLEAQAIVKDFPGVRALDHVDFELRKGEIHAILGENGAGKSTLIKIIGGVYTSDAGVIKINGERVDYNSPRTAQMMGIRVIHQELNLLPNLSVSENIFLGNLPMGTIPGFVDWQLLRKKSQEILDSLQVNIDLSAKAGELSSGEQQIIEIAQALTSNVNILIMDEPTAALTDSEIKNLFNFLKRMAAEGIAIIYITHRIQEVLNITDRVTVLRDGKHIGTVNTAETSKDSLISMMVGRSFAEMYPRDHSRKPGKVIFEARNISLEGGLVKDISFSVREGEVVGIYGLLGSGRSLLVKALFGVLKLSSGEIFMNGERVFINSSHQAKKLGIGYVPAERKTESLIPMLSLRENLTIASLEQYVRQLFFVDEAREKVSCRNWIEALSIRVPSSETPISSLSGGNQQKVVISRWLDTHAKFLILHEPTRGIDVGAKVEIYKLIDQLCKEGHGILMISSEMPEIMSIADQLLVMSAGEITGKFMHDSVDQEQLIASAMQNL